MGDVVNHEHLENEEAIFVLNGTGTLEVGVFVGTAPGGPPEQVVFKKVLDVSAEVPYWQDEEDG
jgi:hypothetical protein